MATWYRPTESRHKRVVFQSLDPAEPKRQRRTYQLAFVGMILFVLLQAIYFWSK